MKFAVVVSYSGMAEMVYAATSEGHANEIIEQIQQTDPLANDYEFRVLPIKEA